MANAGKDQNSVSTMTGISNADETTILPMKAVAASHRLKVHDATNGTLSGDRALHDQNHVPTLTAYSSSADGTIIPLYTNSSDGSLLINSN